MKKNKYKSNKKNRMIGLALPLSFVMLVGCGKEVGEMEKVVEEIVVVDTISLEQRDFTIGGEFIGTISPYEAAYVIPFVTGEITNVAVELGQEIKEGEVLCKIDSDSASLQLESAKSQYNTAAAQVNQTMGSATKSQDIQTDSGIQQMEGQVDNAELSLEAAKTSVDDLDGNLDNIDSVINKASESIKSTTTKYQSALQIKKSMDALGMTTLNKDDYQIASDTIPESDGESSDAESETPEGESSDAESEISEGEESGVPDGELTKDVESVATQVNTQKDRTVEGTNTNAKKIAVCVAAEEAGIDDSDVTAVGLASLESQVASAQSTYKQAITQKPQIEQGLKSGKEGVKQAQVALETLNKTLDSNKQIAEITKGESRIETKAMLDAQIESASLGVKSAQMQLDMYTITTPISGVVESVNVTENGMATSGNIAFIISNKESITVTFFVSEAIRNTLILGQPITVDKSGELHYGTIMEIGEMVDQQTGLFQIKGNVKADGIDLLTGSSVVIHTDTYKDEDSYLIPYDAVYYEEGNAYVYIEEDGIAVKRDIEVGLFTDDMISVISGITSDTVVITSWSPNLRDGVAVKVKGE